MRPYRGLTRDGKMVYGWYFEIRDISYILYAGETYDDELVLIGGYIEVIPSTVGQATGLKDKNYWEGDILESQDGLRRYVITYSEQQLKWYLKGIGKAWDENSPAWWSDYHKVGNIHQNPELEAGQ